MRFLRYKALKSVMGSGRAGPGREYSDFSVKYERTRSARCARSLVIIPFIARRLKHRLYVIQYFGMVLTLARTGGLVQPPPLRFFVDSKKKRRRVAPPGFGLPYGANLAQFLAKKKLTESGQVTEL